MNTEDSLHDGRDNRILLGDRSGVALILVIGLLALMVVMGVTFSIYMRTERMAAGNFLNDVRARNLLHAALNRALAGADAGVSNGIYPPWDALASSSTGEYVNVAVTPASFSHLPLGAFSSQGISLERRGFLVATNVPSTIAAGTVLNLTSLSYGSITQIVQQGGNYEVYHTRLQGGDRTLWEVGDSFRFLQPGWIDLPAGTDEGRVAYVVINSSGLLDANHAGGLARGPGTNANEIQIVSLPEIVPANESAFYTARTPLPYETLQELTVLGTNNGSLRTRPLHFATYSAFPTNGAVYVGGDVASVVSRKDEIIAAFTNSSSGSSAITLAQAGYLFTNLVDYVDADDKPGNLGDPAAPSVLDGPYVEPVWMFNESYVSNRFAFNFTGSNYVLSGSLFIRPECFFPFVAGDRSGCSFNMRIVFTNCVADGIPSVLFMPSVNPYVRPATAINSAQPYWAPIALPVPISGVGTTFAAPPVSVHMEALVTAWVTKGGDLVDACTGTPVVLSWDSLRQASGSNYVISGSADKECRDPRRNWDGNSHWAASLSNNTLGAVNTRTLQDLGLLGLPPPGDSVARRDGDTAMYVANAPLRSVGELGYLYFGNIWETVRIYKHGTVPQHQVLDYFTVEAGSSPLSRGKVNVNTRQRESLRAVFDDMPLDLPGGTGTNRLAPPLLDTVVDSVMGLTGQTNMTSLATMGSVNWSSLLPGGSELDKEGFIRNSTGLLHTRQNLFTILLYAQTTKVVPTMSQKNIVAGLGGLAEVWRDPVATNGFRTQTIRYFTVLSE
jgi:hypothetical protein